MHFLRFTAAALVLWAGAACADDEVSPELLAQFNELARRAEKARAAKGPQAAIQLYEDALLEGDGYGRINLRLGQLYQAEGKGAEAADHYRRCIRDERVDAIDREVTCEPGYLATTSQLHIDGLPERGRVVVLEPELFAGAFRSGDLLPNGQVRLMVEAPGREPRSSTLQLEGDLRWTAVVGLELRGGPVVVPNDFVNPPDNEIPADFVGEAPPPAEGQPILPIVTAGVGVAMVGAGLYLGLDAHSALDDTRARQNSGGCTAFCGSELSDAKNQAVLADGLWIGGSTLAISGLVWWYLTAPEGE